MKNDSIRNHYLSSILPFQTLPHLKQFVKSREFYKPGECIWNNPHRTSKRLYPYFHQYHDKYLQNVKPKIEEMIEEDRVSIEN